MTNSPLSSVLTPETIFPLSLIETVTYERGALFDFSVIFPETVPGFWA